MWKGVGVQRILKRENSFFDKYVFLVNDLHLIPKFMCVGPANTLVIVVLIARGKTGRSSTKFNAVSGSKANLKLYIFLLANKNEGRPNVLIRGDIIMITVFTK